MQARAVGCNMGRPRLDAESVRLTFLYRLALQQQRAEDLGLFKDRIDQLRVQLVGDKSAVRQS